MEYRVSPFCTVWYTGCGGAGGVSITVSGSFGRGGVGGGVSAGGCGGVTRLTAIAGVGCDCLKEIC